MTETTVDTIADVASRLAALPARFHVATEPPPGAVSLAALADPATARALIDAHGSARNLADVEWGRPSQPGQVAASLTVQGITMRLAGSVLAAAVLHRELVLADPADVHVGVAGPMFSVTITSAEIHTAPSAHDLLEPFAAHWLDGHLRSLVEHVRRAQRVGEALLWGNVASAVAATFVFFDWWDPDCEARELATRVLRLGTPSLGLTSWLTDVEVGGRTGLRSERAACCLVKLVPGAHLCPTCPKSTEAERIASTSEHVHHLFAVRNGASGPPPWAARS